MSENEMTTPTISTEECLLWLGIIERDSALNMIEDIKVLQPALLAIRTKLLDYENFLKTRAGKLLQKGTPFFVVKANEPYARQVIEMIKQHEGENWTEEDEAFAQQALSEYEKAGGGI